jgi:AcrR family transcriptional regulator
MADNGSVLTGKQEKALASLLLHPTLDRAAEAAGVGERTLYRWLRESEAFTAEYRARRHQALDQATAQLATLAGEAAAVLGVLMLDPNTPHGVRGACAGRILDLALKSRDEVSERLEALEAQIAELRELVAQR